MSSPNNNKSPSAGNVDGAGDERPRLTEEEKKQNHIASELVPGLEGQGRSEGLVLKRTVDYMHEQIAERQRLIARIEAAGGQVDEQHTRDMLHQLQRLSTLQNQQNQQSQ
ncbi:Transcription factor [Fusarium irregulare]|nr:hypothetical protein LB507_004507 [Fusarium sp. FIESC RH6]KAJ4023146.1 Transcription factor [Fusarium irregulare]